MKIILMASGFMVFSVAAFAQSRPQRPDVGSEQSLTVDGMKEKCKMFQSSDQLKPFSIKVECSKTATQWDRVSNKRPLPQTIEYKATGTGKGALQEENAKEELAP